MPGAVELFLTYKFIKILTTPWEKQEAYKFGIIDENGKTIRKSNSLKTIEEKNSFSLFHKLIFNLKRLLEKFPFGKRRLASYAAGLFLLKEHINNNFDNITIYPEIEQTFYKYVKDNGLLPDFNNLNEKFELYDDVDILESGKYKLNSGDIIELTENINSVDCILGVEIFKINDKVFTNEEIQRII